MLNRLPIRVRLTLAFAVVMTVVLVAGALFIRISLRDGLDQSIRQALRSRAVDVSALARDGDALRPEAGRSALTEGGATFAQVLGPTGAILDATPLLRSSRLLTPAQVAAAQKGPLFVDVSEVPGLNEPTRLLAVPAGGDVPGAVVVVGTGLGNRNDAIGDLTTFLLIAGPIALILASAAGYGVASAALRPVEEMRTRAERISGSGQGDRLPLAAADDEIRRLGLTLNQLLERTDAALAHERAFVADASHELRTPLAILKTELELALRGDHSAHELREAVASAGEETDRLVRLAEDLLVIARSDQGGLPMRTESLPADGLLETAAARFASRAEASGRTLSSEGGEGLEVWADRARIEQALANLVENALSHGGGPVRLVARAGDGAAELHVMDAGPGLDPEFRPQAFDRFARADVARARGGSGLGLAIVRAVARAHGGEAHIDNLPAGGVDAWISLPTGSTASDRGGRVTGAPAP